MKWVQNIIIRLFKFGFSHLGQDQMCMVKKGQDRHSEKYMLGLFQPLQFERLVTRTINADDIKLDGNMEHHWKLDLSNNWLLYHNWWFSNKLERLSFFPSFLGGEYPMITGPKGWWGLGCDKWRWTQKKVSDRCRLAVGNNTSQLLWAGESQNRPITRIVNPVRQLNILFFSIGDPGTFLRDPGWAMSQCVAVCCSVLLQWVYLGTECSDHVHCIQIDITK